ncbi:acyl-CoA synthetase family member 2, mitochondrial [Plakobranchus ocellatus]|uniref:Medium-chain acyl-CoA ligase ACSF2, mitochondrial n=1 Tax=Plakobranchus ocellatus TaxID=259542 RepID=A0AAV4DH43_9GAST|nr:acyl-CoA synthetase family member 2, mitochondrial [Plakobranchus ocellatus]
MASVNKAPQRDLDTVPKRLKYLADHYPEREIFICVSKDTRDAFTAVRLLQLAEKFAARLVRQGFRHGDVIANTLPNSPERVVADVGLMLAGCTGMNGQILMADGSDFLGSSWKARCNGVILCPENWSAAWQMLGPSITDRHAGLFSPMSHEQVPDLTTAVLVWPRQSALHRPSFLEELEACEEDPPNLDLCQPEDVLYVLTTSGNTGYSKLIPHTHKEVIEIAAPVYLGPAGTATVNTANVVKVFNVRPLGWVGGSPFKTYVLGEVRVMVDTLTTQGHCDVTDILAGIKREKCSTGFVMPLEVEALLDHMTQEEIKDFRLKVIITGGQPIKRRQVARALLLSETVVVAYASSEAGLIAFKAYQDATKFEDFCGGKLVRGMAIRVVADNDQDCPCGVIGKILIKGPGVFRGFFNRHNTPDPSDASAFTSDGWYRTEDFGWFSATADGSQELYALGRAKDVISRDGIHLYPGWLEAKVIQHKDVIDVCILPYHKICAIVKTSPDSQLDEDGLRSFCHNMFLGNTNDNYVPVPDYYKILRGKDFPETATGKPNLHALRKIAEKSFGANELAPHFKA